MTQGGTTGNVGRHTCPGACHWLHGDHGERRQAGDHSQARRSALDARGQSLLLQRQLARRQTGCRF